jgi:hypothetical protein
MRPRRPACRQACHPGRTEQGNPRPVAPLAEVAPDRLPVCGDAADVAIEHLATRSVMALVAQLPALQTPSHGVVPKARENARSAADMCGDGRVTVSPLTHADVDDRRGSRRSVMVHVRVFLAASPLPGSVASIRRWVHWPDLLAGAEDGLDGAQGGKVGEGITVDSEQVGIEAGGDAPLA